MTQRAIPSRDVSTGAWTPTPVYWQINDMIQPGTTFVTSGNITGDSFQVNLTSVLSPPTPVVGNETVLISLRKTSAANATVTVFLLVNGMYVTYFTIPAASITQSYQPFSHNLSPVEIGILQAVGYSNLGLKVVVGSAITYQCARLPGGAAQYLTFTMTGISNDLCNDCDNLNNNRTVLRNVGGCQWNGDAYYCGGLKGACYILWYNAPAGTWELDFDGGGVIWSAPVTSWNGLSPLIMTLNFVRSPGNCATFPTSITLNPIAT